jgi:long-chain fatty acid transport protein
MRNAVIAGGVAALVATSAGAGGLDRSGQGVGIVFKEGNQFEASFGQLDSTVKGTYAGGAMTSGDVAPSYTVTGFGLRTQINEALALAVVIDQPFGADVSYPATGTFAGLVNTRASVSSSAITALAHYRLDDGMSVLGGLKAQSASMTVAIPGGGALNYTGAGAENQSYGFVLGAAYEIPDIALRASLVYHSAVEHDFATTESSIATGGASVTSTTKVKMPQAINLDFQTGINPSTLLTAGVRWADWTSTRIAPNHYSNTLGRGALQDYTKDIYTLSVGLGRRITDALAVSATVSYEDQQGGVKGNLAPTDGYTSLALGAAYRMEAVEISGGLRYVSIGDATSSGGGGFQGTFSGNSAIGVGVRVSVSF